MTDEQILKMTTEEALQFLDQIHLPTKQIAHEDLHSTVKKCQRTRTLGLWHDHDTLFGHGYIMVTIQVYYDPAVFLSNGEANLPPGKDLQTIVELPEVHMLAICGDSHAEQAVLVPDRVSCLPDLNQTLSDNGCEIKDVLRFFSGDHPAQSVERGCQQGGNFPCGSCGVRADMISDIAHSQTCQWRSLSEQQQIVLAGRHGSRPELKPFHHFKKDQLQAELQARGIFTEGLKKDIMEAELMGILRGIQRVPSLLLQNPQQPLSALNLDKYTVLDCEPLHDIKGHLENLFSELLLLLRPEVAAACSSILDVTVTKQKAKGSDYRMAAILVLLCLLEHSQEGSSLILMQTIVEIMMVMYSNDEKRTPKQILRLFNITWLHAEVCANTLSHPSSVSQRKMFGIYFHAIVCHAAPQFEIVCLKSVNAEDQEHLFGQAESITGNTSNQHPNHVIPNLLLQIQAQANKQTRNSIQEQQSKISKMASQLYKGIHSEKAAYLASSPHMDCPVPPGW